MKPFVQIRIKRDPFRTDHLADDLGARSASGAVVALTGQIGSTVIQLGNTAILARILTPADFGVFALAMVLVGFAGIFTNLGLSVAAVQMEELDRNIASGLFFMNLALGTAAMIVCVISAPLMVWFLGQPKLLWAVLGLAAAIPISAATVQFYALLVRGMRWHEMQAVTIAPQLVGFGVGVGSALLGAGYLALVFASGAVALSRLVLTICFSHWWPSRVSNWTACWRAVHFGAYYTGFMLSNFLHKQIDIFLIGRYWGVQDAGFYNRAYQLMSMPLNAVSGPLGSVFMPALSRLQGNPARWQQAFVRAMLVTALVGCAAASVLTVSAPDIIQILMGPGWDQTAILFFWLSLSMIFTFPMGAAAWAFTSRGRSKELFHWGLISTGLLSVVFLLTVPHGATAVAQGYSVTVSLLTPLCFGMALGKTEVSVSRVFLELAPLWIASIAAMLVGHAIDGFESLILLRVAVRSAGTIGIFLLCLVPFVVWRPSYRRIAVDGVNLARAYLK